MVPESACIPIPSEATMLFAGFNVSEGKYSLFAAVAVGTVANVIGAWIAYAVGYYGRLELLDRYKVFHVKPEHLALTERWFERWGSWAVFFSRMLPIVRTFISLPAGMLTLVGKAARDNWEDWQSRLHYVDYAMAVLIVAAVVFFGQRWWRARRARLATDVA
jgi:membrane protein DedA with SNARE-associated domain